MGQVGSCWGVGGGLWVRSEVGQVGVLLLLDRMVCTAMPGQSHTDTPVPAIGLCEPDCRSYICTFAAVPSLS